jgi:hypothetical protein
MGSSIDIFWTVSITAARATLTRPDRPRYIKKATLRDNLRVRDGQFMKSLRFTLYNVAKQVPLTCYVSIGLHSSSSPPVSYWYQKHSTSLTAHSDIYEQLNRLCVRADGVTANPQQSHSGSGSSIAYLHASIQKFKTVRAQGIACTYIYAFAYCIPLVLEGDFQKT